MPVFLDIRQPLVKSTVEKYGAKDIPSGSDGIISTAWSDMERRYYDYTDEQAKTERVKKGDIVEIVAFEPTQIKSATNNVGTFDQNNPDIRYQFVGEKGAADVTTETIDANSKSEDLYRSDDTIKNRIEALFNQAISGEFKGKPISISRLTDEGKAYLEQISGASFKEKVDFVLNPSDLMHIYKDHFGNNEKDKGQNIPLDIEDI